MTTFTSWCARCCSPLARGAFGTAWLVGFVLWFSSFTLPNNQYPDGSPIPRSDVWRGLTDLLLENVFPTRGPGSPPSGWWYLPQRFDLLATAGVILAGAWGLGHLTLRLIALRRLLAPAEQTVFAFALGLSGWSLLTLMFGVAGMLNRWVFGALLSLVVAAELWHRWHSRRTVTPHVNREADDQEPWAISLEACAVLAAVFPFVLAMLLGSMLPSTDFDVKEYHLQGPKEFFLQGRVTFLPHNVYTSFPFLTEMLLLMGMVLRDDWFRGALAGQVVLMTFAPLTALALFGAARRWFGPTAGWMAVLVHLTIPWTYRISIIAYAEGGLTFFLLASLVAVMLRQTASDEREVLRRTLLAGLLAGSGVACKYPGVISVAIPLGAAVIVTSLVSSGQGGSRRTATASPSSSPAPRQELRPSGPKLRFAVTSGGVFLLGTLVTFGPWMVKNVAETGNPVYPLLYTVFGGEDWNDDLNAKWRSGHAAPSWLLREPSLIPADLAAHAIDVAAKSDWQSPLVFALAPLALFRHGLRRIVLALWMYVLWLFLTWWALTHRIDRFWLPLLPVASLLAGAGLSWLMSGAREPTPSDQLEPNGIGSGRTAGQLVVSAVAGTVVAACVMFNLGFVTSPLSGYNAYLIDLDAARRQAATPSIRLLNELPLPENARVLFVGEAQVFDAEFDHVYNTVFDESIFERWTSAALPGVPSAAQPLRSMEDIRATFDRHGITHVFVNWNEIARYRAPGSYGFTEFVTAQRFRDLVDGGVLSEAPLDPRWGYQLFTVN